MSQGGRLSLKSGGLFVQHAEPFSACARRDGLHINIRKATHKTFQFDRVKQCVVGALDYSRRVFANGVVSWTSRISFFKVGA